MMIILYEIFHQDLDEEDEHMSETPIFFLPKNRPPRAYYKIEENTFTPAHLYKH